MATEHIERIANIVASEPITSGGAIGSGSYIVDGQSDLDITVTEGASVRLIVASDAAFSILLSSSRSSSRRIN